MNKVHAMVTKTKEFAVQHASEITFAMISFAVFSSKVVVAADGGASGLALEIIKLIGKLIIALGIFLSIMGVVHFASAHAEGDGPAKQKAVMQIASGVMVILLSSILTQGTTSQTLASYITSE